MAEGLGYGRRRLIEKIINIHWNKEPENKHFSYQELLFVIQEMLEEEGKSYLEPGVSMRYGHKVFRAFVKYLMYRNLANYDSMVLISSEKGCITDDSLIEMPRDLKKYPKGIPVKKLIGKKDFYVYSFNIKTQKLEVKKAKTCEFAKRADVYEVELTNGQKLKATDDHPFLMMDGSYKQLKDLIHHKHIRSDGRVGYCYTGKNDNRGYGILTDRLRMVVRFGKSLNNDVLKIDYRLKQKISNNIKYKKEHNFIWEEINGKIPKGHLIHHKNGIHYDDRIENLQCVTYSEHYKIHRNNKQLCVPYPKNYIRPLCTTKNGSVECNLKHSIQRIDYLNNPENKDDVKKFLEKGVI